MISKLRKKIIAINVISVCIVFLVSEILMFSLGFVRLDNERNTRVSAAFDFDYENENFDSNKLLNDVVLVVYDTKTQDVVFKGVGKETDFDSDELNEYVNQAIESDARSGWLLLWRVKYYKLVENDVAEIVICNSTLRGRGNMPYVLISGGTLLIGILCYLVISWILARIALAPVEESWSKQRQFVADASHELKTPLSVIMANTDIISSHQDETVASQMKWIENTRTESERMAELIADLLFLAKHDDGRQVQMEVVNVSECVENSSLSYDAVFYENGKEFNFEIAPNVKAFGNEGQLKQLVAILLDNANKYSKDKGNILLGLSCNGKKILLTVSNDSDELSEENLKRLFDRFYTVDKSRNTDKGGSGLGLSIAKTICESHSGDITVDYENGRISFTIELPAYRQRKAD